MPQKYERFFESATKEGLEKKIAENDDELIRYKVNFEKKEEFFYEMSQELAYIGCGSSIDEALNNISINDYKIAKSVFSAKVKYSMLKADFERYSRCKALMRKGNILNTLGALRALDIYGKKLTKEDFSFLVKENYRIKELDEGFKTKIDDVWKKLGQYLRTSGELESFSDECIVSKEPSIKYWEI